MTVEEDNIITDERVDDIPIASSSVTITQSGRQSKKRKRSDEVDIQVSFDFLSGLFFFTGLTYSEDLVTGLPACNIRIEKFSVRIVRTDLGGKTHNNEATPDFLVLRACYSTWN